VSRPAISVKTKVDVAIGQARDGAITCRLCGCRLRPGERRVLEHNPPRATLKKLGIQDPDHPRYLEWVHWACAQVKTRGKTGTSDKHSVADGDTHKIAKGDRLSISRLAKAEVEQRVGHDPGFRLKKKMDGSVVRVRTR
jgi:hypothetical protein